MVFGREVLWRFTCAPVFGASSRHVCVCSSRKSLSFKRFLLLFSTLFDSFLHSVWLMLQSPALIAFAAILDPEHVVLSVRQIDFRG